MSSRKMSVIKRGSGILLHITSLPSPFGIGDIGPGAYRFADFLAETGQSCWQVLPLNPTDQATDNSPYSSSSAFAGNPMLISPELLVDDGLLTGKEMDNHPDFPRDRVDYADVIAFKGKLLKAACERFKKKRDKKDYEKFCLENALWLEDFALFSVLKERFGGAVWNAWPAELKGRNSRWLQKVKRELEGELEHRKFLQYLFFKQWHLLKGYCNERNIRIFGDMPIYVRFDSADVWTHPEIFKLDKKMQPAFVAGVPPDYFSETGQLWGNPVYRWDALKQTGYEWWIQRMEQNLKLFDLMRIDHFRGFVAYWQVPASEKTAVNGKWVKAPVEDFFKALLEHFGTLPIIAEDLGFITEDVKEVMGRFGFPGMKVLLFAFGDDLAKNPYVPHNHIENCVIYTGTHDNNTARGWFENEAVEKTKKNFFRYLGREVSPEEAHAVLVRLAMMSVAEMAIIPMQDILGLAEKARMNHPGTGDGNWRWRLLPEQLTPALIENLSEMTETYGRATSNVR